MFHLIVILQKRPAHGEWSGFLRLLLLRYDTHCTSAETGAEAPSANSSLSNELETDNS